MTVPLSRNPEIVLALYFNIRDIKIGHPSPPGRPFNRRDRVRDPTRPPSCRTF
jgi:hypothetical protein